MDINNYKGSTGKVLMGIQISFGILLLVVTIAVAHYCIARFGLRLRLLLCLRLTPPPPHPAATLAALSGINEDSISTEVIGLDESALLSFPTLLYSQAKLGAYGADSTAPCCSICLTDYRESDTLRFLPECGHLFHQKCVDPWLRLRPTCPNCRNSPLPSPLATPLAEVTPIAWQPH